MTKKKRPTPVAFTAGMTVAQLVTRLSRLNQNAAVFIYTDSGCRESIAIDATLEGIVDLQWEV